MKKICHFSTVHPSYDIRVFHRECKSLTKAGYSVTLIASHEGSEDVDGVRIVPLPKAGGRVQRIFGSTARMLRLALKQNADVYHFHDPELILVGLILKMHGKKVIYDVHEDYPKSILSKSYLPKRSRKFLSFTLNLLEKSISRYFDLVVVATDRIQQNFSNRRSVVIHNYPFAFNLGERKERNNSSFKIIYPGPLCEIRGIGQILKALESMGRNNVELILIGDFTDADFEAHVRSLEIWSKVKYMGVLPHSDVMERLLEADLGIECSLPVPNYLHAESNKIFEYMAAGLPVLCSNLPRIQEIVEGSQCGICVDPLDVRGIADNIEFLSANPDIRKSMGDNGRKAALGEYNWNKDAKKLVGAYARLLNHV